MELPEDMTIEKMDSLGQKLFAAESILGALEKVVHIASKQLCSLEFHDIENVLIEAANNMIIWVNRLHNARADLSEAYETRHGEIQGLEELLQMGGETDEAPGDPARP